jgi:hypothetical protein
MKKVFIFACVLLALVFAGWYGLTQSGYFTPGGTLSPSLAASAGAADGSALENVVTEPAPPLGPEYRNTKYRFSVQMPADFTAQELDVDENGGQAIVLQDAKGNGIQIYITPDTSGMSSLSADDVRASIPDMRVVDAQDVELGTEKGVAFMSDNEAFGGASREVWFYFGGKLYQISTYARLDPLLRAMFGTWKFF